MSNVVTSKPSFPRGQHDQPSIKYSTILRSDEAASNQRNIHWKGPLLLVTSLIIGVGAAFAHHLLYDRYDGELALPADQERLHFAGLALARIVSMLLTLAAAIAFRQWIWRLLRRESFPIGSIDTLSVLDSSMFELVTGWKTWPLATFAMLLAVFLNCIQIPSLVTPGSLSTEIVSKSDTLSMNVPTTRICQFGFDASNPSNRLDGNALWNTANVNNTGCYAYYDSTSDRINSGLNKVLWGTSYAGQIPQLKSPCGVNGNCSYTLSYLAPTLKCSSILPPATSPMFGDMGGYLPQNYTSGEDYVGLFFMAFGGTVAKRTFEGVNSTVYMSFNMTLLTGVSPVTYKSWDCGFFNTSMAFNFSYTGQSSSQVVLQQPPNYLNEIDFHDDIFGYDTYLGPNSVETYWTQMTGLFAGIVQGQIGQSSHDVYDASGFSPNTFTFSQRTANLSAARDTSLGRYIYTGPDRVTAGYDLSAPGDAGTALEEISRNVSVAMTQIMEFEQRTPVTFTNDVLVFRYTWKTLVLPYAAGLFITLVIIAFGIIGLVSNGMLSDFRFSTVLRTTRNDAPEFSRLFRGSQLGASPLPEAIEKTKLRFGCVVSDATGEVGMAFGLEGQLSPGEGLNERERHIRDLKG